MPTCARAQVSMRRMSPEIEMERPRRRRTTWACRACPAPRAGPARPGGAGAPSADGKTVDIGVMLGVRTPGTTVSGSDTLTVVRTVYDERGKPGSAQPGKARASVATSDDRAIALRSISAIFAGSRPLGTETQRDECVPRHERQRLRRPRGSGFLAAKHHAREHRPRQAALGGSERRARVSLSDRADDPAGFCTRRLRRGVHSGVPWRNGGVGQREDAGTAHQHRRRESLRAGQPRRPLPSSATDRRRSSSRFRSRS